MPYLNQYNMQIAQQLRNIDQNHINRIQAISETNEFDVRSPLEATALVNALAVIEFNQKYYLFFKIIFNRYD